MNRCFRKFGTQDEQDRARKEWFLNLGQRKQKLDQEEVDRKENEKKLKEWWGLDENWNRIQEGKQAPQPTASLRGNVRSNG